MSWFLYLIECADDSVYTGITTDVAARFDEHASGKGARYTRSRKPRAVLASFPLPDRSSASRAEYWVKRLTPAQKRELAAGLRTLKSVLPAEADIDASGDAAGSTADVRGRKKAKAAKAGRATTSADAEQVAKQADRTGKADRAGKAGKGTKSAKSLKAVKTTKAAKGGTARDATRAEPVAERAKADSAAAAKKTASRRSRPDGDVPAPAPSPRKKKPAAAGKPAANDREDGAPAPARRRPSAAQGASDTPRRAPRAKDATDLAAAPAARTSRRKTPRAKQNRAAS
ncbi:excinuclease ABC subunit C [Burkholderia sp. MSh2]|uniref:GIY-YIG nuclease family protein n=1 Tax=Burkholderia TaxID=32008 RepID=UPI0004D54044|nr:MULTISPECIES: GIY-YIG nuclease family protein [Burkholderia]KEZ03545.1 excinuclease ABC subunit C [Burkholderia sp. MSh2]